MDENLNRQIDIRAKKVISDYMQTSGFSDRKLTDTPLDSLQVVNRKYVTLNGTVALRPASTAAIVGQHYFSTDTNIPMTYNGTTWRDGIGSIVASN